MRFHKNKTKYKATGPTDIESDKVDQNIAKAVSNQELTAKSLSTMSF